MLTGSFNQARRGGSNGMHAPTIVLSSVVLC
jgi:hypothetical protein